jgi:4-amino-4-deoxy-L-arabinose transferase-like glycosyltransferase
MIGITSAGPETVTTSTARQRSWPTAALVALLVTTAVCWLIGLSRSGWANAFYSAAVQAGSKSWKAALFGSCDAANSITVDKPPAALWPMEISVRLFGLNSWSLLVPQVLLGVATVALLYVTVRRTFGPAAGLLAGALLAVTPVATLMFRYNNPDALLVFLTVAGAWALLRAVEDGRTRWLVGCGTLLGLGFLTKQLQVMLVVPGLAGTYLFAGPTRLAARVSQLLAGLAAMVAAAGWWVALVELTPAVDRPYIGGSTDNSFLNLTFGYNGLSRLTGHHPAGFPDNNGIPGSPHPWSRSHAGVMRLFTGESGGQISWLLPAALILLVAGLWWRGRAPRTDPARAQYLLWGGWMLVGAAVLSAMSGTYHDYYTIALAPAVAALVAVGLAEGWRRRDQLSARLVVMAAGALTAVWSWVILGRTTDFVPALRWIVLIGGLGAAVALMMSWSFVSVVVLAAAMLAGPAAYCIQTVANVHQGGIVNAGPRLPGTDRSGLPTGSRGYGGIWAGMQSTDVGPDTTKMLTDGSGSYTWIAATQGANRAAAYQLATGDPVMPIGGFVGRDPAPTLDQFQRYVAEHRIHYFVDSPRGTGANEPKAPSSTPSQADHITDWVKSTFMPQTWDGVTVYDLTAKR